MGHIPFYALLENGFFLLLIVLLAPFLGVYIYRLFDSYNPYHLYRIEKGCLKICGITAPEPMDWVKYLKALIIFNLVGFFFLMLILLFQGKLPLNPQSYPNLNFLPAFNIAISFAANTSWQSYAGETILSHFSQMAGLTVQNFFSAATGYAIFLTLVRGLRNQGSKNLGNFWCDLLRTVLFLLLPLSILLAVFYVQQGVIQTFDPAKIVETVENRKQMIPLGPVASQEAIKQLGANGGGFFRADSAHPFENPTPLTNLLGSLAMILIPAASCFAFGLFIESKWDGVVIFFVMLFFLAIGLFLALYFEFAPLAGFDHHRLLEGKELRNGISGSIFWTLSSAATSNDAVNASLISFTPMTKGLAFVYILLRNTIFGAVGIGLSLFILFILLSSFFAGLLAAVSPEYQGKKIEAREVVLTLAAILIPGICLLLSLFLTSFFPLVEGGTQGIRPWFYAFSSTISHSEFIFNNLSFIKPLHELALGILSLISRLSVLIPILAIAGSLSEKKKDGKFGMVKIFTTSSLTFTFLLIGTIIFFSLYPFLPFLAGGPIHEQLIKGDG